MKSKTCSICGSRMKRNGKTKTGSQRWRCLSCGSSSTHVNDVSARDLKLFIKDSQLDMAGQGRSFRRTTSRFWDLWPMPEVVDEIHRVVYVDGIYLSRDVVIFIACSNDYVLSWYLARSETSSAWAALLSKIAPPDVVITDGGSGFEKARKQEWPDTKVQRCLFHAFCQVKRCTTTKPRLQAGIELYSLAKELLHIGSLKQAEWWIERFLQWCDFWAEFMEDKSLIGNRWEYTHERLRKARRGLVSLVNQGTMFTYLDPYLSMQGPLPATNNRIEGGVNAQIRSVLRNHRGMSLLRRIKAVYWWCYMHTECPADAATILKTMPTDKDIETLYEQYALNPNESDAPRWGDGLVWEEMHHKTKYPYAIY